VLAADLVGSWVGFPIGLVMGSSPGTRRVVLALDADAGPAGADPAERHSLTVTEDRIDLAAPCAAGLFRGLATLRQLVARTSDGVEVPAVVIQDAPATPGGD